MPTTTRVAVQLLRLCVSGGTPPRFHAAADLAEDEEVAGNLAQACRSLRSILAVAVAVEVIAADPCRLRNAGTPKAARPSPALTVARPLAEQLATDRRTERYRTAVLVVASGALDRWGHRAPPP